MQKDINVTLSPKEASDEKYYRLLVAKELGVNEKDITALIVKRKSFDARKKPVKVNMMLQVFVGENPEIDKYLPDFQNVSNKPSVIIVGCGPGGLFAALRLIELGFKPIIFERGKEVSMRKKDVAGLSRGLEIDPNSNYCFGEGGAGTFSDGKLYTRSKKRGDSNYIMQMLNFHGANDTIFYEAHPHLGSEKLPEIIKNIRKSINDAGGEIHFNKRVVDFIISDNNIKGVVTQDNETIESKAVVLATGHSARDIYYLLHKKKIEIEAKSFAVGIRIEHPQEIIDSIQYHKDKRGDYLPAATYSIAQQVGGRGVYSFCMCPGGFIVPAASDTNQIVVNGMSPSKRNSPYANSGIVVETKMDDLEAFQEYGVLAGLKFQEEIEKKAFDNSNGNQQAPAQRMVDFIKNKPSSSLPDCSYIPGINSSQLHKWLPRHVKSRMQQGFSLFNNKMRGYITNEAVLVGVESRTSSPIRIPRDKETLQHIHINGLYPCGEGAGYAGGIMSSAIDGVRIAEKCALFVK